MKKDIEKHLDTIKDKNDEITKSLYELSESENFKDIGELLNKLTESVEERSKIISEEKLKYLNKFNTIIHDEKNYFGYYIQGNYIQFYVAYEGYRPEFFQYKIKDIYNIYSGSENEIKINSYGDNSGVYFNLEDKHIDKVILIITHVLSNEKKDIIQ